MKRVVVPIDGSDTSKGVVDYAIYYANREEAAEMLFLHVMTILEHEPVFYGEAEVILPPSDDTVKEEFRKFIEERMEVAGQRIPRMSISVRKGRVYDQIVRFAEEEDADIIMIGHRGLSPMQRFFLGSVAAKVVAQAPCSVYVHRPKEKREDYR
ncbi:MAG: universal stress protein [Synergistaceae bacterium]|nr:universal stress protein [Synergistota bacterium]NLM72374.1 universal stress protein [Synergistaceae bacterium]